jgi:surface antigen
MRRFRTPMAVAMVALTLAGCANQQGVYSRGSSNGGGIAGTGIDKSMIGTAVGAVGGAWIGSNVGKGKGNVAAIAAGTLLGAALGNSLGGSLDRADQAYYGQTAQRSLESARSGTQSSWVNPDTGNGGTFTPMSITQNQSGQFCREFSQTINVGGRSEQAYGTACRQQDGTWKIVQ